MNDIRWRGLSHQQIYDTVFAGRGHFASIGAQSMWTQVETQFENVHTFLLSATNRIGAGWEGTAAEQASRNLVALGNWVSQAARSAAKTGRALDDQAQFVATMRNELPPPPPSTPPEAPMSTGDPAFDLAALNDWQDEDVRRQEAAERAVQVMETYTANSAQNKPHIHAFASPLAATAAGAPVGVPAAPAPGVGGGPGAPLLGPGPLDVPAAGPAGPPPPPPTGGPGALPPVGGPGGGVPVPVTPLPPPAGRVPGAPGTRPPLPDPLSPGPGSRPAPRPGDPVVRGPGGVPGGGPRPDAPVGGPRGVPRVPGFPGGPGLPGGSGVPGFPGGASVPGGSGVPGSGAEPGAGNRGGGPLGTAPPSAAANRTGLGGGYVPGAGFGAGAGAAQREHRRPSYLLDDTDAFADDRWFTSAVITPDDPLPGAARR